MMVRKFMAASAALVLAGVMAASMVHAKACPALCAQEIKACKLTCTEKPKAKCKRACKVGFVKACRATSDVAKDRTCPSSPLAAFLD